MFTLSDKQRVLNSNNDVKFYNTAGTAIAAPASLTDSIVIDGYGKFNIADILEFKMQRGVAATAESKDYTCVAPSGLQIGETIEVVIELRNERYSGEVQNDFIGGSAPIVFATAPLAATTASAIRDAIVDAFENFKLNAHNSKMVIDVVDGTAGTDIEVKAVPTYESITVKSVKIRRGTNLGAFPNPLVALAVSATNAEGTEGVNTGKFLEESVRMETAHNLGSYGIDTYGVGVDVRGLYTECHFVINAPHTGNLSTMAVDHGPLPATAAFSVWMNEATMIASGGAIEGVAEAGVLAAGNVATIALTDSDASTPGTLAGADEALVIADGTSVDNAADFIA